jgi:hypothetical protein
MVMKINWSTVSLDPSLMAKLQTMWEGGDPYAEARLAARRVLDIVKESVATSKSCGLLHSDAVRSTTLFLQTLLRKNQQEHPDKIIEVTEACREGIALCRSLVPAVLAKAEDTIEKLLDGYSLHARPHTNRDRHLERAAKVLPPRDDPVVSPMLPTAAVGSSFHVGLIEQARPFSFPFDSTPMDLLFPVTGFQDISFLQHSQHNFPELESFG